MLRTSGSQRERPSFQTELPIDVAPKASRKVIQAGRCAGYPRIVRSTIQGFQLSPQIRITKRTAPRPLGKRQQVREETIKQLDDIFKTFLFIFREEGGRSEERGRVAEGSGLREQGKDRGAEAGGILEVEGESGAWGTLGKMSGEGAIGGGKVGAGSEERLDLRERDGSEMELDTAGTDGGKKGIGARGDEDERGGIGRLLEDFEEGVGIAPAHGIGVIEDEDAAM